MKNIKAKSFLHYSENKFPGHEHGFSALVLVLIIGISSLIMAKGAAWLGLRELDMGTSANMGKKAAYVSEGCIEEVLLKFQKDPNYSASEGSLTIDDCACTYDIISNGNEKIINTEGECQGYSIGHKLSIDTGDGIEIKNWDFK